MAEPIYYDGNTCWFEHGQRHRIDGPACEHTDGTKLWYQFDKCHRLDGPAAIWSDGVEEYYIKGIKYDKDIYDRLIKLMAFL